MALDSTTRRRSEQYSLHSNLFAEGGIGIIPLDATERERERDRVIRTATLHPLPGDNSCVVPPDPIPNSEVKRANADGSVHPHARVGHRQGLYPKPPASAGGFSFLAFDNPDGAARVSLERSRQGIVSAVRGS